MRPFGVDSARARRRQVDREAQRCRHVATRTRHYGAVGRNPRTIDISEKLLEIAPVEMSKVLLQCSGSEANDTGVKIAWYYWNALGQPKRRKIITRMGSYHGSTCVATSMTGNAAYHRSFGLPFSEFLHTDIQTSIARGSQARPKNSFPQG
jgi:adenosylmethionine-8-amino-7-oxononanoate aminotransferase